jgi:hypothetical protein
MTATGVAAVAALQVICGGEDDAEAFKVIVFGCKVLLG